MQMTLRLLSVDHTLSSTAKELNHLHMKWWSTVKALQVMSGWDQSLSERKESLIVRFQIRAPRLKQTNKQSMLWSEGGLGASVVILYMINFLLCIESVLAMDDERGSIIWGQSTGLGVRNPGSSSCPVTECNHGWAPYLSDSHLQSEEDESYTISTIPTPSHLFFLKNWF